VDKSGISKRRRDFFRRLGIIPLIVMVCLLTASCTNKAARRGKALDVFFDSGDYIAVADSIKRNGEKLYGEKSEFLFHMDLGILYHYAGEYSQSNIHLQRAAQVYDDLFTKSVTNEAAAIMVNDNVRPYRSKPYELTQVHQFAALNFMAMGEFDGAIVEARKAQLLFNEWERIQAKSNRFHTDGMFHLMTSLAYERVKERDNSVISLFKSVDAYNKGPIKLPEEVAGFAYERLMADNREHDITTLGIGPNTGSNRWDAKYGESEIVIVGHAGRAPIMKELKWYGVYVPGGHLRFNTVYNNKKGAVNVRRSFEISAPLLPNDKDVRSDQRVPVTIALPELVPFLSKTSHFTARLEDTDEVYSSVLLNNIAAQAGKAYDDGFAEMMARTVVRAVVRTITANKTKDIANSSNSLVGTLVSIGTDIATITMEQADLRMCFMLPESIHIIRIPVEPGRHSVTLNVYDKSGQRMGQKTFSNVDVRRGEKKVLIYNSLK